MYFTVYICCRIWYLHVLSNLVLVKKVWVSVVTALAFFIFRCVTKKRTARVMLDESLDHPSNPLFKELNWLPLQSRITYLVALLVFKIHNDLAPNYLNTILLFTSNNRYELRSESRWHLVQPKKKLYYSNLTLQSLSAPIWNNIP